MLSPRLRWLTPVVVFPWNGVCSRDERCRRCTLEAPQPATPAAVESRRARCRGPLVAPAFLLPETARQGCRPRAPSRSAPARHSGWRHPEHILPEGCPWSTLKRIKRPEACSQSCRLLRGSAESPRQPLHSARCRCWPGKAHPGGEGKRQQGDRPFGQESAQLSLDARRLKILHRRAPLTPGLRTGWPHQ